MYESSKAAGIDLKLNKHTICTNIEDMSHEPFIGAKNVTSGFVYGTIALLAPFWAYLALAVTHDCFRCFGKDPNRNYSQFQYSTWERIEQKRCRRGYQTA